MAEFNVALSSGWIPVNDTGKKIMFYSKSHVIKGRDQVDVENKTQMILLEMRKNRDTVLNVANSLMNYRFIPTHFLISPVLPKNSHKII